MQVVYAFRKSVKHIIWQLLRGAAQSETVRYSGHF